MKKLENQILHHQRQLAKWQATSERSFGLNDRWFHRATRQVKFHTQQVAELEAELAEAWAEVAMQNAFNSQR
jgi:hypothetical protein